MRIKDTLPGSDLFILDKPPGWITVSRPGYRDRHIEEYSDHNNELYGAGNWQIVHYYDNKFIDRSQVLRLCEKATISFLEQNPDLVKWLTESASDIYELSELDVKSGTDYDHQESTLYHYQDIALRRILQDKNLSLSGSEIIKLSGKDNPASQLSSKKIPFHKPERILRPRIKGRWSKGSIEDFWQCNKLLQVKGRIYLESSPPELALILRRDLKLGKGKFAAQASHGAITRIYQSPFNDKWSKKWDKSKEMSIWTVTDLKDLIDIENSCRKWGIENIIIRDAGHTQIPQGTKTCIAMGPAPRNYIHLILSQVSNAQEIL